MVTRRVGICVMRRSGGAELSVELSLLHRQFLQPSKDGAYLFDHVVNQLHVVSMDRRCVVNGGSMFCLTAMRRTGGRTFRWRTRRASWVRDEVGEVNGVEHGAGV